MGRRLNQNRAHADRGNFRETELKNYLLIALSMATCSAAVAQTYVQPHVRKDGTYVEGHMRSAPNNTTNDNYSTKGNYNPYTGQQGTVQPNYAPTPAYQAPQPSYPQPSYGQSCSYINGRQVCR